MLERKFRTKACAFFAKGRCTRGDECSYSHNPTMTAASRAAKAKQSEKRRMLKGKVCMCATREICPFGRQCKFAHKGNEEDSKTVEGVDGDGSGKTGEAAGGSEEDLDIDVVSEEKGST